MSIRTNYPMMFDSTVIPFPLIYSEEMQTVDSVRQTEAGTDIVTVARYKKLRASMTIVCLQPTLQALSNFADEDSFVFKRYDPKTNAYEQKTVRMRNFNYILRKGSEDLTVNGVWEVSFDIEEF